MSRDVFEPTSSEDCEFPGCTRRGVIIRHMTSGDKVRLCGQPHIAPLADEDPQCCQYWPNGHAEDCPNMAAQSPAEALADQLAQIKNAERRAWATATHPIGVTSCPQCGRLPSEHFYSAEDSETYCPNMRGGSR